MIEPESADRDFLSRPVHDAKTALDDPADPREGHLRGAAERLDAITVFRRGAKEKFVVIASAENGAAALFFRKSAKRLGFRTSVPLHDGTHAASLENVSEVLQKTVRNVNGRVRETPQTATYGDARSRIVHAGSKLRQSPFGVEPNARADHEGRVGVPRRAGKRHE